MLVKNAPVLLFCVDITFQFWVFVEERVGPDVVSLASPSEFNGWIFLLWHSVVCTAEFLS